MNKLFKAVAILVLGTALVLGTSTGLMGTVVPSAKDSSIVYVTGGVWYSDFIEFNEATMDFKKGDTLRLIIHTSGGDAFATVAICNRMLELKEMGVHIVTEVYSQALSAGSYMFLMGDERIMHKGGQLMWHTIEAQATAFAKSRGQELEDVVSPSFMISMRHLDNYVRALFAEVTGMSEESCEFWLDGGAAQYMSAETAYNVGIATELK